MAHQFHPDFFTVPVASGTEKDPLVLEGIVRKLHDDSLFLSWTGGGCGEPTKENVTKYKRSFDNGRTWSEEKILFAHPKKGIFTPCLFAVDGKLIAFPNSYYNDTGFCQDMQSYMSESTDCGETFSFPHSIPNGVNNVHIKCALTYKGRWYLPCSWIEITGAYWASFTDANKPCVVAGKEYSCPHDLTDTVLTGMQWYDDWYLGGHTEYCGVLISDDCGKSFRLCGKIGHPGTYFVEPMMVPLSDGTLVMLLRTHDHALWESRSYDGGEHWTEPQATDIPSPITKVLLLRDSAGKIYLVHNPSITGRNPLALWISRDDMRTWETKVNLAWDDTPRMPLCYPDGFLDEKRGLLGLSWDDRRNIYYSEFPMV